MGWIRKETPKPVHVCKTPTRMQPVPLPPKSLRAKNFVKPPDREVVDGNPGDIWACDECALVWEMKSPSPIRRPDGRLYYPDAKWTKASRRMQRKHAPRYECGCRYGHGVERCCKGNYDGPGLHYLHGSRRPTISPNAGSFDGEIPD